MWTHLGNTAAQSLADETGEAKQNITHTRWDTIKVKQETNTEAKTETHELETGTGDKTWIYD